jgi:very-short-patch-repair endonuclease
MTEVPSPFLGSEAVAAGVRTYRQLRKDIRIYPDVYIRKGMELSAKKRAEAAWLWSRRRGVVCGNSAAAVLGARWVSPDAPGELNYVNRRPPPLVVIHTETLLPGETAAAAGMAVTSAARTAFDIGRHAPPALAVQRLDALAHATDIRAVDVEAVLARHPGVRGVDRLRRVLPLIDGGAESPQETRTRLLLIRSGFPKPRTQIPVYDAYGDLLARLDMGWDDWRVGVEYDGAQHWTDPSQRTRDIDRMAALEAQGWRIIRVNSDLLNYRQGTIVSRVDQALRARGWSPRV